ncbi:MAG TPA: peptidoglycan-binding domain-containing protein, partial [Kiloniellaceae bacterium]
EGPRDVGALIGSVKSRGSDRDPAVLPPLEEVTVPQLPPATYDRNDYARIQLLLEEAGHSPGPVDGQWGPRTQRALAAFQNDQGLRPSGKPDAATLDALGFY